MRSTVLSFLLLSLWGGAAALAAWVVCRLLRRAHAPSRFLCWLWLAVGLRFVLPFGIPLAPVSYTHLTLPTIYSV